MEKESKTGGEQGWEGEKASSPGKRWGRMDGI